MGTVSPTTLTHLPYCAALLLLTKLLAPPAQIPSATRSGQAELLILAESEASGPALLSVGVRRHRRAL